jgi:hypothetical protein
MTVPATVGRGPNRHRDVIDHCGYGLLRADFVRADNDPWVELEDDERRV